MRRGLGQSLGPVAPSSVGQSPSDSERPAGADSDQASWTWANWGDWGDKVCPISCFLVIIYTAYFTCRLPCAVM